MVAIMAVRPASAAEHNAEEAALQKNAEAFVDAFHRGDAKTLAGLWTADGDYTDQRGRRIKERRILLCRSQLFLELQDCATQLLKLLFQLPATWTRLPCPSAHDPS
jgi:hypothetical protein